MITLYGFFPAFGMPAASPFAIKTDVQLKMSGLSFEYGEGGLPKNGPKGKIPYIKDGDRLIGDSELIRAHLEDRYGTDLDRDMSAKQRGMAWATERMLEDHLYWGVVRERWLDDALFAKGPAHYFDKLPQATRDTVREERRQNIRNTLHAHGLGRHTQEEIVFLCSGSIRSLATLIGDKPYLMGDKPCGADATAFAFACWTMAPYFPGPIQQKAAGLPVLQAYTERMMAEFYPQTTGTAS